jgi:hypothetical protein
MKRTGADDAGLREEVYTMRSGRKCASWAAPTLGLLVTTVIVSSCFGGGGGGGGIAIPCETQLAQGLTTDTTGKVLAQAVKDHVPTNVEMKETAVFLAMMAVVETNGQLDEDAFSLQLGARMLDIASAYPSFLGTCSSGTTSPGMAQQGLSPQDFDCSMSCLPSAASLQKTLSEIGKDVVKAAVKDTTLQGLYEFTMTVAKGVKGLQKVGKSFEEAIDESVSDSDALTILKTVGNGIAGAGAIAAAAGLLGATAPELGVIAAVGAEVGTLILFADIGSEVVKAEQAYSDCKAQKSQNCSFSGNGGSGGGGTGGSGSTSGGTSTSSSTGGLTGMCGDSAFPVNCGAFCCTPQAPICGTGKCCAPTEMPCASGCCPSTTCPPKQAVDCQTCCPGDSCCKSDLICCGDCDTGCK